MTNLTTPSLAEHASAIARQETIVDDSLLQCVSWVCEHYDLGKSKEALVADLPRAGLLSPSLALAALGNAGLTGGLVKRPLRQLPQQVMPMILIRHGQAACVLVSRRDSMDKNGKALSSYLVILPEVSDQVVELPEQEIEAQYAGYAILAKPRAKTDQRAGETLPQSKGHWLFSTLWRYRRYYRSAAIAAVLANVLALASIFFTMNVYDRVVPNQAFVTLWSLGIGVVVAMIFEAIIRFVRAHLLDIAAKKADLVIGSMLFRQALSVQMEYKPASSGSFANQLREFESVRDFSTSATLAAISDLPFVILFVAVIFAIGGPLGWITLLVLPLILIISACIQWPLARTMQENLQESLPQARCVGRVDRRHGNTQGHQWRSAHAAALAELQCHASHQRHEVASSFQCRHGRSGLFAASSDRRAGHCRCVSDRRRQPDNGRIDSHRDAR